MKQRKANALLSKWSFAELHALIAYKALHNNSMAIKVDANYTSQACPICGHTSQENRPGKGLLFVCQRCHYTLHADLVGARNLTMRTLLIRQDWMSTGCLSTTPDVSTEEAKAARLARYADLRWKSETSPCLQTGVVDFDPQTFVEFVLPGTQYVHKKESNIWTAVFESTPSTKLP